MTRADAHKWEFKARFRRHAFGWKSQPAITRIKEAVNEIKRVAKADPVLGAEGAVVFLERVSPAIEQVDSSSGAISTAVSNAIATLVPIIVAAPVSRADREAWLERLWEACELDDIPYLESLGDHWGELCASPEVASSWADRLLPTLRHAWSPAPERRGWFKGTPHCLSALLAAGRHDDLLEVLSSSPHRMWHDRQYGVRALAAQGRLDEAIRYAEEGRGLNDSPLAIARVAEELLLAAGRTDEAYPHGLIGSRAGTYLATFRAVAKKYPKKPREQILADLVKTTPGDEGKWFAAAKDAGLYDAAIALARRTPCDPKTLTRAARDHAEDQPLFAVEAGLLALYWLLGGYGYEVTSADVGDAWSATMRAADVAGKRAEARARVQALLDGTSSAAPFREMVQRLLASATPP